jgi:REP element-mobilizing transposase RayT
MPKARWVLPGTYLITRRVLHQRFLLRPDDIMNEVVTFCLAEAGTEFGVEVHQVTVMSNHIHIVCTFADADSMPGFAQRFHRHVACAANVVRKRTGIFWDPERDYAVFLDGPERILEAMAYSAANPCASDLVDDPRRWPGLWTGPEHIGTTLSAARPKHYFRAEPEGVEEEGARDGVVESASETDGGTAGPAATDHARRTFLRRSAELRITRPPGFDELTDEAFKASFARLLGEKRAAHAARRAATGKHVLGRRAVLLQDPESQPANGPDRKVRGSRRRPRFATSTPERREVLAAHWRAFAEAYDEARRRVLNREPDVLFPWGTYGPRVFFGARCHEAPPPGVPAAA